MTTDTATDTITWNGKSGKGYKYGIYPIGTEFKDEPGNYIFVRQLDQDRFRSLYVGETGSLHDRVSSPESHHKWDCVSQAGATHICAHINSGGEKARREEETDLIENLAPECND
ncbi:MAG: hypothetical protein IIC91_08800 [Chloroflexi bacterium]|nr:hypothetical protein [Chloroflexota bacterium]